MVVQRRIVVRSSVDFDNVDGQGCCLRGSDAVVGPEQGRIGSLVAIAETRRAVVAKFTSRIVEPKD